MRHWIIAAIFGTLAIGASASTPAGGYFWRGLPVETTPPELVSPITIDVSTLTPINWPSYSGLPAGPMISLDESPGHSYRLNANQDYLVIASAALTVPLRLNGGRRFWVRGVHLKPVPPTAGNSNNPGQWHPRLPGGSAFQIYTRNDVWVDGCHIDVGGAEADATVIGGVYESEPSNVATNLLDFYFTNCLIRGVRGGEPANGIHGDIIQLQNRVAHSVSYENCTLLSNYEGAVLSPVVPGYPGVQQFTLKRVNYSDDPRYTGQPNSSPQGGAFMYDTPNITTQDLYLHQAGGSNCLFQYVQSGTTYVTVWGAGNPLPGTTFGSAPPGGNFAPESAVGLFYTSPWLGGRPPPTKRDFNGDSRGDVLLRNPSSGQVYLWLMK